MSVVQIQLSTHLRLRRSHVPSISPSSGSSSLWKQGGGGIGNINPIGPFDPLRGRRLVLMRRRATSAKVSKGGFRVAAASGDVSAPWDSWKPEKSASAPKFSDILWPSAGAFAAMATLGRMDQLLGPKGLSMSIAPLGAVSAILFTSPSAPAARKYNMFMAQIGCAAIGVLAFSMLGPGWLARSTALAASIAFMIYTRSNHPPAASLPLLFIDGAKFHHLSFWYAFFPGAAGCLILCLIQEIVSFLRDNVKF